MRVSEFYERHPYPPPVDDLRAYRDSWTDARRRADAHLFFPREAFRDDRSILVAGCGTMQAAHYAVRWPNARVTGIDVSETSIACARELKDRYELDNLDLRQLSIERVGELGANFDYIVCTGVLHHLQDPDRGLQALRAVLASAGALHLMVYAPYGRAGVYMLQEYCRRLGVGLSDDEIDDLASTLRALPIDHPLVPLLRHAPDFATKAGLADALLHPCDRAYSVPQFFEFVRNAGLTFGRWLLQAPYSAECGGIASTPHAGRLATLPFEERCAAVELLRGTMVRHSAILYRDDSAVDGMADFKAERSLGDVLVRMPGAITVTQRLPAGAAAVLINRGHTYNDLYLPIDERELRLLDAIDDKRSIAEICAMDEAPGIARAFLERLWKWDQVLPASSTSFA